jgi:hypothetical protein
VTLSYNDFRRRRPFPGRPGRPGSDLMTVPVISCSRIIASFVV